MHNAPAVSFPVGRSRFQAWFLGAAWLAGAAACAYWGSMMDISGWRHGVAVALSLAAGATAWAHWRQPTAGTLHWNGECWRLDAPPLAATPSLAGDLAVHLDFQRFLLLSLRPEQGAVRWLWLDQCADQPLWRAFRRAVHS